MEKTEEMTGFTPTGVVYKSTELPDTTDKTHKDLGLSKDEVLELFRKMYLQRRFEERSAQMYQKGKFGGFLHLYMGQEAISTGVVTVLNDDDDIITAYRDHGFGLMRGISANEAMAELYGKVTGCSRGKGGSMHYFNVKDHFWGGHAIVGAHIPLAAGLAFANKYRDEKRIAVGFFGDGAVDQGSLHETFNLAKVWNLPVIFVVENNGYSMGTAAKRHTATDIYKRALAYDMKHDVINGMDVFSVIDKFGEAVDYVREHQEPYFLEIRTYRYRGHSMSDPGNYRSKEEMDEFKAIDPIERLKSYISKHKIASKDQLEAIMEEIEKEVLDSIDFAENSDYPPEEELYHAVYAEDDYDFLV